MRNIYACDCTRGCTETAVRESALKVDWETNRLPHQGIEPASVLRLAFRSDALPIELHNKIVCSIDNKGSTSGEGWKDVS